jgi:predicted DNA-binding protein (MmcQ/YjbR family)
LAKTGPPVGNMGRLEDIVSRLPEAVRVDIEAWNDEPTFRVNGKNFIFANPDATSITVKLPKEEAAAVVGTDPQVEPTGYGLGRHGWISVAIPSRTSERRWQEIEEWIRTSFTLIAPKRLQRIVLAEDGAGGRRHPVSLLAQSVPDGADVR